LCVLAPILSLPHAQDVWRLEEARKDAGLEQDAFDAQLEVLLRSLPGIDARHPALFPRIIAQLVQASDRVADRLIELKQLLPSINAVETLLRAPWVLRSSDWTETVGHVRGLVQTYGSAAVCDWVARDPELLEPEYERTGRTNSSMPDYPAIDGLFAPRGCPGATHLTRACK